MSRATHVKIHLDALTHNFQRVRALAPASQVMAVVKANGYGHGVLPVARSMADADAFALATIEEAVELRLGGITQPLVVLQGANDREDLQQAVQANLDLVIHNPSQLDLLSLWSGQLPSRLWFKLDTGMHRFGLDPEQFRQAHTRLQAEFPHISMRVMSHFSDADDLQSPATARQLEGFDQIVSGLDIPQSLANSAAIISRPETHRQWVRPGIMLYGVSPFHQPDSADYGLIPAMTFTSRILSIRQLPAGEPVGYGGRFVTRRPSRIALVPVGYADGYPRHLPDATPVLVEGQMASLAGRVSMDSITLDITDLPQAQAGDEVVLWGRGLPVEKVARLAGTIAYELLTGVSVRVPRHLA